MAAIFNLCAAAHWCEAKGRQMCRRNLGEGRKEARKKLRNKNIAKIHNKKSIINIIFKNNTIIKILAIELIYTISLHIILS
jgi:hypothetical protein